MSITVGELLKINGLHLRLLNHASLEALRHHIVWIHQSEILDSRTFSEPGEVLLTVGLNLPEWDSDARGDNLRQQQSHFESVCEEYIIGMCEAGVLACGFGTGVKHRKVPDVLVDVAEKNDLPVFEVPLEIPFQAIEKEVFHSLAEDEYADLRTVYSAQRRLIAAAHSENPTHSVILKTAESIGGWAAFLAPTGEVVDSSHIAPRGVARDLGLEFIERRNMQRDSSHRPRTMFFLRDGLDCSISEVLYNSVETLGYVVAGIQQSEKSDMSLRSAVTVAAEILSVSAPVSRLESRRMSHTRSVVLRQAFNGDTSLARELSDDLWGGAPRSPIKVCCIRDAGVEHHEETRSDILVAREIYESLSSRVEMIRADATLVHSSNPVLFGFHDAMLWIVMDANSEQSVLQTLSSVLKGRRESIGISAEHSWSDLTKAADEALLSEKLGGYASAIVSGFSYAGKLTSVASQGDISVPVMGIDRLASLNQLDLVAPEIADAFANAFFDPLLGDEVKSTRQGTILMSTLMSFVDCSFNIKHCSEKLGVHRHTIENRIIKIQQMLGVDFARAEDVSRVWFAANAFKRSQARNAQGLAPMQP
ncbi:PucR family transcriptional regulator [Bifidobacterium sp.]|jgi:hypothetical protein|uniref:PucR family transcriptional regulator n=1 Tax=Bifidobacterium sp. TaxID=41200 RepID=UPI0025BD86D9|nr:PucR family transcriptional regulator [Bifidobacterium sp.]MCI1634649.1 PucR family transcriptional regulator [Bifidobacterium sp.]